MHSFHCITTISTTQQPRSCIRRNSKGHIFNSSTDRIGGQKTSSHSSNLFFCTEIPGTNSRRRIHRNHQSRFRFHRNARGKRNLEYVVGLDSLDIFSTSIVHRHRRHYYLLSLIFVINDSPKCDYTYNPKNIPCEIES